MKTALLPAAFLTGVAITTLASACSTLQPPLPVTRVETRVTTTATAVPSPDPDADGILGANDACPQKAETVNGYQDQDGCPDQKPVAAPKPVVRVKAASVEIAEKIQFANNSADIHADSDGLIAEIASALKSHPGVQLIEVQGHASHSGSADYNVRLTQRRSEAVVNALVAQGVSPQRLVPQGLGYYCPLQAGESATANEANRRVDFKILYRDGSKLPVKRACDAAVKAGVKVNALPKQGAPEAS